MLTITSYKQYYVNGSQSGSQVAVGWSGARLTGESVFVGSKVSDTRYTVTIPANTTYNSRSATFRWVQEETSDQQSRIITQAAADNEYEFAITWTSGSNYAETLYVTYPWQVTVADYKTFYIRSRKNGAVFNSISGFTSDASWINITSTTAFTYSLEDNDTGKDRTGTLTLTQAESGYQCRIVVTQTKEPVVEEWKYTFNVVPSTLNFAASGGTKSCTVTSYKVKWINGVEQPLTKTNVDWNSTSNNSWLSRVDTSTTSCAITAAANTNTSSREGSVSFTQTESTNYVRVACTQDAKVEDVYVFKWGDGSETDVSAGPFKANEGGFTIGPPKMPAISTKNGVTHGYSVTSKPSWLEVRLGDTIVVDLTKNISTSSRSGSIVLTQNDSGKTLTINLSQTGYAYEFQWVNGGVVESPDVISYTYTISPGFVLDSTSIMNTLVSTRSMDNWTNNAEKVDVTVIDTPEINWLTVVVDDYGVTENPGLMDVKLSGTVPDTPGITYTVQFLQHESAKVCKLYIVVQDKPSCRISILSAKQEGSKVNLTISSQYAVASNMTIYYRYFTADGLHVEQASTNWLFAGSSSVSTSDGLTEGVTWDYVELLRCTPTSDSTYDYLTEIGTFTIAHPVNLSADCKFMGSFDYASQSDQARSIPLTNVMNFDGSTSNTDHLTVPGKYNQQGTTLKLSGTIGFNVEAHNNTTSSMTAITVELLASESSSDVGTEQGVLIQGWTEFYPTGGLYIWVQKSNETIEYDLSTLGSGQYGKDLYLWFNVKVTYSNYDTPSIAVTTSSVNLNIVGE